MRAGGRLDVGSDQGPLSEAAVAFYLRVLDDEGRLGTGGLSEAELDLVSELAQMALLEPDGESVYELRAVDPRLASIKVKARRYESAMRKLGAAESLPAHVERLSQAFHDNIPAGAPVSGTSEIVTGGANVAHRIAALIDECSDELLIVRPSPPVDDTGEIRAREIAAAARPGVISRTLLRTATRFVPAHRAWVGAVLQAGGEVRTEDMLIEPLLVVDRVAAVIPADLEADPSGAEGICVISDQAAVEYLRSAFTTVWGEAWPFAPDGDTAAAADRLKASILRLMAQGLEQAAIGEILGLAPRTMNKYVALLKADYKVSSLFQLGAAVARGR